MVYMVTANQLALRCQELGAGRVCFNNGEYSFSGPTQDEIGRVLSLHAGSKFKLQSINGSKWEDLTRYEPVIDAKKLFADISKCDLGSMDSVVIGLAGRHYPDRLHPALRRIFYDTIDGHLRNPNSQNLNRVSTYFSTYVEVWNDDERFQYFVTYLQLLDELFGIGLEKFRTSRDVEALEEISEMLISRLDNLGAGSSGSTAAFRCILGQVTSLTDRRDASTHFSVLRNSEHAELIRYFYYDLGALTYFDEDDLTDEGLSKKAQDIIASICPVEVPETENKVAIALSMDSNFFRIYSAWLYFYAQQLPEIDFNFFLCAPEDEVGKLVSDGAKFVDGLSGLNHSPAPSNIHIYRVPTPEYVVDKITFYACARFFAIDGLLERYQNIYLMDADLYLESDPTTFLRKIKGLTFSVPATTSGHALSPWRRYMAGNVAINREAKGGKLISDLQRYIVKGLHQSGSWMLDQNALAFAIEENPQLEFIALNEFKRPFIASKFMKTWETNYRRSVSR